MSRVAFLTSKPTGDRFFRRRVVLASSADVTYRWYTAWPNPTTCATRKKSKRTNLLSSTRSFELAKIILKFLSSLPFPNRVFSHYTSLSKETRNQERNTVVLKKYFFARKFDSLGIFFTVYCCDFSINNVLIGISYKNYFISL